MRPDTPLRMPICCAGAGAGRRLFGKSSEPYPEYYTPKPYSRSFVRHLDVWYAQSHPDEDFAETFAVWLDPQSAWRERYAGWPVLKKLEFMDTINGRSWPGVEPPVTSRQQLDPLPASIQDAPRSL